MTTKAKRIQKTVIYKRCNFHVSVPGESLKTLLEKALSKSTTVGQRRLNVADVDNPIYHVMGAPLCEPKGFVFGALMTYTPGTDPLFLVDDEQALDVMIEKLKAPNTQDGKRREFLESMMYFGAIQDHLVLIQSQALKAPQLEAYLQWFLHDAKVLAGDNTFQLVDTPSKAVREKMASGSGVRTISLGGEVIPQSAMARFQPPAEANEKASPVSTMKSHSLSVVASATQEDWGVLEALKKLMAPSQAAKINFDQLTGSNIEMSVVLRYKKETTEDGQKLMDTLGAAFRNTEDVETVLELKDGGQIRGADLKLNGIVRVTSYDGQLSATEVFEGMRQWLLSKVTSDELSAS
jgi:hypothetical protein